MGASSTRLAARPCGRLPERRQRRFGIALRRRGRAVADAGHRRARPKRFAIRRPDVPVAVGGARPATPPNRGCPSGGTARRGRRGSSGRRIGLHGVPESPRSAVRRSRVRRPVRACITRVYDTHEYVTRFADPEFRYTTTLVKVLGIVALRLMDGDAIPLDVQATASAIARYVGEVEPVECGRRAEASSPACRSALARARTGGGSVQRRARLGRRGRRCRAGSRS